jgi:hypothetical protein
MVCPRNDDPTKGAYCPAWWPLVEEETHEVGGVRKKTGRKRDNPMCAFQALPRYLNETAALSAECAETAQSHRNVVAEGLTLLTGLPVTGTGALLPDEWRAKVLVGVEGGEDAASSGRALPEAAEGA